MDNAAFGDRVDGAAKRRAGEAHSVGFHGRWKFVCRGPDGRVKWTDFIDNLVVDAGINDILEQWGNGSAYTAAHYVGLTATAPTPAAGDTMSSHAGWTEVTAYDEATRVAYDPAAASSKILTNSASTATFTISTNSTVVGGAFLTTNNTKGGTTGTLISAGAFSAGDKSLDDGDTLDVTLSITGSSS